MTIFYFCKKLIMHQEARSTTKGFLPPRMTTTQRDAITSHTTGLMVYDTTVNKVSVYNGTAWKYLLYE